VSTSILLSHTPPVHKIQYMIMRLIGYQYPYGRLYNRTCIANIVSRVNARHPYVIPDEIERDDYLVDCLVDLSPDKWQRIIRQLENLRATMLRTDASLVVLPSELDDNNKPVEDREGEVPLPEEDDSINEALESHADFNANYEKLMDLLKFHLCLSHLQPQLHMAIQASSIVGAESVVIPHDNIIAFE
jgi:hypothetical protein